MKKFFLLPLFLVLFVVAGLIWFYKSSGPASTSEDFKYFVITKGQTATQVGQKLETAGLIKSGLAFKVYLQFSGQTKSLQTGEFRLSPSYSLFQTVSALFKGPVELWVTIPEGLRREEIAQRFASALGRDDNFIEEFQQESTGDEGYLFPDTYLFPREASSSAIVNRVLNTFNTKTKDLSNNSGLSFDQVIVLASILERETKTDEERPVVAGILLNRLNAGMPLQADATVQYAVAKNDPLCKNLSSKCDWWPDLTLDDIGFDSPFNTYKYRGLPPSPIANPGLSSIKAALNPEENDYWYYIHDSKGQIHYARTLSEHNANISKYLR